MLRPAGLYGDATTIGRQSRYRYAYRPVLLETFVEKPRFTGACYKAANWHYLGDTQGRGKLDTLHRRSKPVKSVWIYPSRATSAASSAMSK